MRNKNVENPTDCFCLTHNHVY